jgi:hypothetical protein
MEISVRVACLDRDRSYPVGPFCPSGPSGDVAEWLGNGLQIHVRGFDSRRHLQLSPTNMTPVPSRSLLAALWVSGLGVTGCIPTHAAFMRLAVTFPEGRPQGLAILDVPIDKLQARNQDLDPERLAVYYMGRKPIPHELLDPNHDGHPDLVRVKIVPEVDEAWLVFVSPGAPGREKLPDGGQHVRVRYEFQR